jgi:CubicO group peptidase (beta-lactamase class C family)
VTLRHVLSHAVGLASVPGTGAVPALIDWEDTVDRLAAASPDWEPGTGVGEHSFTYGHLVGELVRRLADAELGAFLAEQITGPLELDIHIGVDPGRQQRILDTVGLDHAYWDQQRGAGPALRRKALGTGVTGTLINSSEWRSGKVPAVNGHATARGLAGFYARLLERALPRGVADPGASGMDHVLGRHVVWTLSGGQLRGGRIAMGGVGGQMAAGDPETGLAWAFLTNALGDGRRAAAVEAALYGCLTSNARAPTVVRWPPKPSSRPVQRSRDGGT